MGRDIASWPKGVTRKEIVKVLSGYKIRREAPRVFEEPGHGESRRRW